MKGTGPFGDIPTSHSTSNRKARGRFTLGIMLLVITCLIVVFVSNSLLFSGGQISVRASQISSPNNPNTGWLHTKTIKLPPTTPGDGVVMLLQVDMADVHILVDALLPFTEAAALRQVSLIASDAAAKEKIDQEIASLRPIYQRRNIQLEVVDSGGDTLFVFRRRAHAFSALYVTSLAAIVQPHQLDAMHHVWQANPAAPIGFHPYALVTAARGDQLRVTGIKRVAPLGKYSFVSLETAMLHKSLLDTFWEGAGSKLTRFVASHPACFPWVLGWYLLEHFGTAPLLVDVWTPAQRRDTTSENECFQNIPALFSSIPLAWATSAVSLVSAVPPRLGSARPRKQIISPRSVASQIQGSSAFIELSCPSATPTNDSGIFDGSHDFTIELWYQPPNLVRSAVLLSNRLVELSIESLRPTLQCGAATYLDAKAVSLGQFTHFAISFNGSGCALFRNGERRAMVPLSSPTNNKRIAQRGDWHKVVVGAQYLGGGTQSSVGTDAGVFQEFRMWSTERAPRDVGYAWKTRWDHERSPLPLDLAAHIPFGDGIRETTGNCQLMLSGPWSTAQGIRLLASKELDRPWFTSPGVSVLEVTGIISAGSASSQTLRQSILHFQQHQFITELIILVSDTVYIIASEDDEFSVPLRWIVASDLQWAHLLAACNDASLPACIILSGLYEPCCISTLSASFLRSPEEVHFLLPALPRGEEPPLHCTPELLNTRTRVRSKLVHPTTVMLSRETASQILDEGAIQWVRGASPTCLFSTLLPRRPVVILTPEAMDHQSASVMSDFFEGLALWREFSSRRSVGTTVSEGLYTEMCASVLGRWTVVSTLIASPPLIRDIDNEVKVKETLLYHGKSRSSSCIFAVDGKKDTKWHVNHAASPGDYVGFLLNEPSVLSGFQLEGMNMLDLAFANVEITIDGNSWDTASDMCKVVKANNEAIGIRCNPRWATGLRLVFASHELLDVQLSEIRPVLHTAQEAKDEKSLRSSKPLSGFTIGVVITANIQPTATVGDTLILLADAVRFGAAGAMVKIVYSGPQIDLREQDVHELLRSLGVTTLPNLEFIVVPRTSYPYEISPDTLLVRRSIDAFEWWKSVGDGLNFDVVLYSPYKPTLFYVLRAHELGLLSTDTVFIAVAGDTTPSTIHAKQQYLSSMRDLAAKFLEEKVIASADAVRFYTPSAATALQQLVRRAGHVTMLHAGAGMQGTGQINIDSRPWQELVVLVTLESSRQIWDLFVGALTSTEGVTFRSVTIADFGGMATKVIDPTPAIRYAISSKLSSLRDIMSYVTTKGTLRLLWILDTSAGASFLTTLALSAGARVMAPRATVPSYVHGTCASMVSYEPTLSGMKSALTSLQLAPIVPPCGIDSASNAAVVSWISELRSIKSTLLPAPYVPPHRSSASSKPLVTVCIPTFNRTDYLAAAIASIMKNNYPNVEIVVVDDGSQRLEDIRYLSQLEETFRRKGPGWKVLRQNHKYAPTARNLAVDNARGKYVLMFDDDDIMREDSISLMVATAERLHAHVVVGWIATFENPGDDIAVDPRSSGRTWAALGADASLGLFGNYYGGAGALFYREAVLHVGGYSTAPPGTGNLDYELVSKLAVAGYRIELVPAELYDYREKTRNSIFRTSKSRFANRMFSLTPYKNWNPYLSGAVEVAYANGVKPDDSTSI